MDKFKDIQTRMTELHIGTKASDIVFHQASERWYETLFGVWHQLSEKRQDIEIDQPIDCDKAKQEAYHLLLDTLVMLEEMVKENKDIGLDNLLR